MHKVDTVQVSSGGSQIHKKSHMQVAPRSQPQLVTVAAKEVVTTVVLEV
jgi:hypothetical protein